MYTLFVILFVTFFFVSCITLLVILCEEVLFLCAFGWFTMKRTDLTDSFVVPGNMNMIMNPAHNYENCYKCKPTSFLVKWHLANSNDSKCILRWSKFSKELDAIQKEYQDYLNHQK